MSPVSTSLSIDHLESCFALLDDAQGTGACSRLYTQLQTEIFISEATPWDAAWVLGQQALDRGLAVLAVLDYETGAALQAIEPRAQTAHVAIAARLLVFEKCTFLDRDQVQDFLKKQSEHQVAGMRHLRENIDHSQFMRSIEKVRDYIAAGDTYQVNYTYRLHFETYGEPLALYCAIRERQPVPYGAFIALASGETILSFSPELFVRHEAGHLLASPMKGTAPASGDDSLDQQTASALQLDEKNRAENLMIVDLLRNDIGRIAVTGSVKVPRLFEVQRYTSVLQMTSSIHAQLRPDCTLAEIMSALFPCGSITGAPKRRTMQIIREIESEARGIYTGAIGWFEPPNNNAKIGNFCLSVPIRTLVLDRPQPSENPSTVIRRGMMGVGAGIVYDSVAQEEYEECQLKAKFLTGLPARFALIETMAASRGLCAHLERHLARLTHSAAHFGFAYNLSQLRQKIESICAAISDDKSDDKSYRLRLELRYDGQSELSCAPLPPLHQVDGKVSFTLKPEVCQTPHFLLAHKTSYRAQYDQAWHEAESAGDFDRIFINQDGRVTEGGRSTLFIRIGENWFTPPIEDGVLPGVMRAVILDDTRWNASEKSITVEELIHADDFMLCNALRGVMMAKLRG